MRLSPLRCTAHTVLGNKRINDIFVESQHIWEDYAGDGAGMVKKCEEETGVTVCSPEEAQRLMEMQNGM